MPTSVTMPRLGESVTEGTVTRWLKAEGEHVDADEPLLEVSTDKVDTEVPSPASGTLLSIKVQEDETVEIGVELAVIGAAGDADSSGDDGAADAEPEPEPAAAEQEPEPAAAAPEPEPEPKPAPAVAAAPKTEPKPAPKPAPEAAPEPAPAGPSASAFADYGSPAATPAPSAAPAASPAASGPSANGASAEDDDEVAGAYVTPLVRKLASEHGVDLAKVQGTGVGGRIRKSDVLAAAEQARAQQPAPAATPASTAAAGRAQAAPSTTATSTSAHLRGKVEPMSRMRQVIAARMVESLQTSAQLTTVVEVDVTKIARLRSAAKADFEKREGVKLSFLPFFAVATIEALKAHPVVNASVDVEAKTITYHDAEHLGIAVDTERGLLAPVIHDAGDLNLGGLARKIADLAERTRANKVSPDELGGGTFTLTNTGSRGALFDTPIINQPQVGILGTGAVVKRAVVVHSEEFGETVAIRSMVYLALSYDHRIVDGADAARFLVTIKERLETGAFENALGLG
ncbi:2-oxoglutarate dehydrogenase, E2 component, dihydrolipoamide succinyltransferase [uncultured Jatrophihabitans sp.]|uniref:2-oxoglutarate dehydrogenase, E2 component, dihydrolipoamide succinyltransferase n=1 Tax=uncultured Jatrophihabitans sp. TaxID=1610747 RepID=UPI0035CB3709